MPQTAGTESRARRGDVRILVIEDVPDEAELTIHYVRKGGIACIWHRVDTELALRDALRDFQPNVILSDFSLPQFSGLTALRIAREVAPNLPFIFVSGTIGEERAIEALRCGAVDYVLKGNLSRLAPAINRALDDAAARLESRRQESQIARLTRVLRMLSGINGAVLRIRDRSELFAEACRLAVTVGGYTTAIVMLPHPTTRAVQPVACSGVDPQATETLRAAVAESVSLGTSIVRRVLKTGAAFVCNDTTDPTATANIQEIMAQTGFRSIVALPLLIDKTAIGVLLLTAPEVGTLSDEELQMLREVAANLAFALQYLQKDNTVRFLSYFDAHTGLAKRSLFCERVGRLWARSGNRGIRSAVAVIDVEKLSVINDSFGRHTGDLLLQHVADRLRRHFHDTELLAQFGGGTFAVALDVTRDAADPIATLQGNLAAIFGRPFEIEGREIPVSVKSGLALYPEDGKEAAVLAQNAEAALRNARASGQPHLHFSLEQHSAVVARLALEHKLRTALERRQFELHYQLKVGIKSRRIDGVEALIRWRDPESGLVLPGAFLPLLESTGLIAEVGDWVLEQAARDCQHWQRLGLPAVRVAVNISPVQLRRPDFAERFLQVSKSWANAGCGLDIEITEGALFDDCAAEVKRLKLLRSVGVRIAIDDFGTGYSSLSRLSDLPIDTLKIDRMFISRLAEDGPGRTLVSTIISLAHAFGMSVVAEGVETEDQLGLLWEMGCDQAQGFLLGKPVSSDVFAELLEKGKGRLKFLAGRREVTGGDES
ncbi:MAG TPA: EAL domain-containing protein [Steroidobacteraceae bacterium]|nr:EAL domain-containing protein [Steroidobacteraceae bacterium]